MRASRELLRGVVRRDAGAGWSSTRRTTRSTRRRSTASTALVHRHNACRAYPAVAHGRITRLRQDRPAAAAARARTGRRRTCASPGDGAERSLYSACHGAGKNDQALRRERALRAPTRSGRVTLRFDYSGAGPMEVPQLDDRGIDDAVNILAEPRHRPPRRQAAAVRGPELRRRGLVRRRALAEQLAGRQPGRRRSRRPRSARPPSAGAPRGRSARCPPAPPSSCAAPRPGRSAAAGRSRPERRHRARARVPGVSLGHARPRYLVEDAPAPVRAFRRDGPGRSARNRVRSDADRGRLAPSARARARGG